MAVPQRVLDIMQSGDVYLCDDVMIGPNVTVVTTGENSVIGAGSVVTKDIPANVIAYGSPCRVAREIGEHDDVYYWRDRVITAPFEKREA